MDNVSTPCSAARRAASLLVSSGCFFAAPLVVAQVPQASVQPASPALPTAPAPMVVSAPPVVAEGSNEASDAERAKKPRQFGGMFDIGVPDGAMLSFVYRPWEMARFHAGAGYNGISPGLRLGGTFLPFGWGPSLSLEYGHYFEGDANGLISSFAGGIEQGSELFERVGYDFVSLRAGIELGGDRFTFFTRGGISYIHTSIHNLNELLDPGDDPTAANTTVVVTQDPTLQAFAPSLNLGLIVQL